jgi:fatty-acyl-CoA synthase
MPLIATMADVIELERVPVGDRLVGSSTYDAIVRVARRLPDKIAIRALTSGMPTEATRDITFAEFRRDVVRAANLFRSLGADPTGAVSSLLPIVPEAFVVAVAAQTAAVANPINPSLDVTHVAALLREARCRLLIVPDPDVVPGIYENVAAVRALVPTIERVLRVGGPPHRDGDDALHFESELVRQPATLAFERTFDPHETASLFHTGGTTNAPKLARHTHRGVLLQCWTWAQTLGGGEGDVVLSGLPPFHVGGAHCAGLSPLSVGATVVLLTPAGLRNRNVVTHFWSHVERFGGTIVGAVPTAWSAVMAFPADGYDLSSVRLCNSGASSMPLELARAIGERFGVPIVEGWGMTETHGYAAMNPAGGECRVGSVGFRTPYTEMIVAHAAGGGIDRVAATGEIGEVFVRGEQVFSGYANDAAQRGSWIEAAANETVPAWSPGGPWFATGDLGRFDPEGYLWLTGRAKDLIVRGGHNIDPSTIEHALERHPAVEMAAAVGRPDAYAGELPIAFVQLRPNVTVTADDLRAFAREHVPERAAAPVEIVVVDLLPLTAIGKIFKPELRLRAARTTLERHVRDAVDDSVAVSVTVEAHPSHGTLATIVLTGSLSEERVAALDRGLDAFALRHALSVRAPERGSPGS